MEYPSKRDYGAKMDFAVKISSPSFNKHDVPVAMMSDRSPSDVEFDLATTNVLRPSFENYHAFGALREGMPVKQLMTGKLFGMVFTTFMAGFAFIWMTYPVKQNVWDYMRKYHPTEFSWVNVVMQWDGVFALFYGMASDCFPMFRLRRKPFIILGWLITFFAAVMMVIVNTLGDPKSQSTATLFLVSLFLQSTGITLAWVITLALSVEYAQRDVLNERGRLQSKLYVIYYFGSSVAVLISALIMFPDDLAVWYTFTFSFNMNTFILCLLCLLPIAFLVFCFEEEPVSMISSVQMGHRWHELWDLLAQKATYMLITGLFFLIVCTAANHTTVNTAGRLYGNFQQKNAIWLLLLVFPFRGLACFLWYKYLINTNWRTFICGGFIFVGVVRVGAMWLQAHDVIRSQIFYCIWFAITQAPLGWILMLQVIPTTEIVQVGREGTVIGLINSITSIVKIGSGLFWPWLQARIGLTVSTKDIKADSDHTRYVVTIATLVVFGFNALCFLMIFFMPAQKLDSQQMVAFGGYHKHPRYFLVALTIALFCGVLYNNVTTFF